MKTSEFLEALEQENIRTEDLPGLLVAELTAKKMKIASAESCTGGLFAALITDVPGAADVLNESFVTYANSAKEKHLGVKHETLETVGAVSRETAYEMATGLQNFAGFIGSAPQ